ncbi:MAG TPA: acyl-CoA dehydrogenase, partial [Solirubrobacteraceae bacterium]|nr:acyl-CoA dehydrogenase [Solirubrobacteraceae bacterium]
LSMALGATAGMGLAWERTAQFARERTAFGMPLSGHQAIRHRLADLATSVYICRCVTYDALRRFHIGEEPLREVTMAKLLTQRAAFELMDACMQIHGGAGYMTEYGIERGVRDSRLGPIGGGSDEIMREILGRLLEL